MPVNQSVGRRPRSAAAWSGMGGWGVGGGVSAAGLGDCNQGRKDDGRRRRRHPRTEVFIGGIIGGTSARGKVAHAIGACCRCDSARARAEGCPAKGAAEQHARVEDNFSVCACRKSSRSSVLWSLEDNGLVECWHNPSARPCQRVGCMLEQQRRRVGWLGTCPAYSPIGSFPETSTRSLRATVDFTFLDSRSMNPTPTQKLWRRCFQISAGHRDERGGWLGTSPALPQRGPKSALAPQQ